MKKFIVATFVAVLAVSSLAACKNWKPLEDGKKGSYKKSKKGAAATK